MKKTHIFLSLALSSICIHANAQYWGTTTVPTNTNNGDVVINAISCPSCGSGGAPVVDMALSIQDESEVSGTGYNHNIFEIDHIAETGTGGFASGPVFIVSAADASTITPRGSGGSPTFNGFVAINKPIAVSTLDVGGSINADANLTVGGNGTINQNLNVGQNGTIAGTLAVQGGLIDMSMPSGDPFRIINANSGIGGLQLESGPGAAAYQQFHAAYEADPGAMTIVCGNGGSGTSFYSFDGSSSWTAQMQITPGGQVVIGADLIDVPLASPGSYDLYVENGILTDKLKVALHTDHTNWSDFVFNKDYELKSLKEVESYVKANKHLPEIPSAGDVAKDGIDVASMDAKLLQKIEELTLYAIQQQKEIDELKKQIKN